MPLNLRSVLSVLVAIPTLIGKIAAGATAYLRVILPIIQGLRSAIPAVDQAMDKIEDLLEVGGEKAGAYLNDRRPALLEVEKWTSRGTVVFAELNSIAVDLRVYSEDRVINADEAEMIGVKLDRFRRLWAEFGAAAEAAEKALLAVEGRG